MNDYAEQIKQAVPFRDAMTLYGVTVNRAGFAREIFIMTALNLVGQKYGRLYVVEKVDSFNGRSRWLCKCDCGNEVIKMGKLLVSGMTRSCGCLAQEARAMSGKAHKKYECSDPLIRAIWQQMISRCENPQNPRYHRYGKRGISVCEDWHNFDLFAEWALSNGYERGLTLERIDTNGNYCAENCTWATYKEQANNKSTNIRYYYGGEEKTLSEWADVFGVNYSALYYRLSAGWDFEKAIKTPVRNHAPYKWTKRHVFCNGN